ncbi:MAG TPA: TetR/AcrR family transcriptional regulator [Spirochaetota bacterium]|nr:TetR/AcrR family transcriptional regulator [Spirochaetota bacterium]HPJ36648.1 TetR/AcrR family transcriptional regulator [Spirochaetota bacterium]HRX48259.1 TetR/AcrR family transcriptional regulator [Spirochaetota bacterium]
MQKGDETKERIIDVSLDLLHRRGYYDTSINDIIENSGIKKGSLYFHYKSKDTLIIEVLNEALERYEQQISEGANHSNPLDQIIDKIDAITGYHVNGDISKGCLFGNMALEIGHDGSDISVLVESIFKRWETNFISLLNQAEKNGEIKLKEPARVLARMILASVEGGVLLSKISGNTESLKDCMKFIKSVIDERRVK